MNRLRSAIDAEAPKADGEGPRLWPLANAPSGDSPAPPIHESEAKEVAAVPVAPRRRRFAQRLGDALGLFLMLLGSITLALLIGLGVYVVWMTRLRGLWAHWIGAPPI